MCAKVLLSFLLFISGCSVSQVSAQSCQNRANDNFRLAYPQCESNLDAFNEPFNVTLSDLFCNETCGPLYETAFTGECTSFSWQRVIEYYRVQCRYNADGMPCYSFYIGNAIDMSYANNEALGLCNSTIRSNSCTDECRDRLTAISNYYGYCVNSVFNSTYFHSFDYELLPLFTYQLWSTCGVAIPPPGVIPTEAAVPTTEQRETTTAAMVPETTAVQVPTTALVPTTDDQEPTAVGGTEVPTTKSGSVVPVTDSVDGLTSTSGGLSTSILSIYNPHFSLYCIRLLFLLMPRMTLCIMSNHCS